MIADFMHACATGPDSDLGLVKMLSIGAKLKLSIISTSGEPPFKAPWSTKTTASAWNGAPFRTATIPKGAPVR